MTYPRRIKYEPGQRYYGFVIQSSAEAVRTAAGKSYTAWHCLCDCGTLFLATTKQIKRGIRRSCGCASRSNRFKQVDARSVVVTSKLNHYKNSAKKRAIEWSLSLGEFGELLLGDCHYCGCVPSTLAKTKNHTYAVNGVDRLDSALGYRRDNCVSCCSPCNRAKGSLSYRAFLGWIRNLKRKDHPLRIVLISDTHLRHNFAVPDGDILIHAGDSTGHGSVRELAEFNAWLGTLPHKHKVVISGNHDLGFEEMPEVARKLITNAIYLQDEEVMIEGLRIYGSPWTPRFFDWGFNLDRGAQLKAKWDLIPPGIDVLITHGPPKGFGDLVGLRGSKNHGENVGCADLLDAVYRVKPQLHVFGHIHEGYGMYAKDGITFVNAAICNVRYAPLNPPIVIDL